MGRKCKCQDTGEYSNTDVAYRAPNGKYYSSEKAWNLYDKNLQYKNKIIDEMYMILQYKSFMKIPSVFYKYLKEWEDFGYDVVLDTINKQKDAFDWALKNKTFKSESAKLIYMSMIIQNNLIDSYKEKQRLQKVIDDTQNKTASIDFGTIIDFETKTKERNVTSLVGDI